MHAIACVILMIGLLKFAQDAPDLLKTLFSNGSSLLKGMNLNPKGQFKNDISGAAKTAVGAGKLGAGIGKGAVGAFAGARAGFNAGKGDQKGAGGLFHGLAGGARGMVAGGSAGANHAGFSGTATAAGYAGRNAAGSKNRQAFGTAQGNYNKSYGFIMDRGKANIDKQKDKKNAADNEYTQRVNDYVNSRLSDENYINEAIIRQQEADTKRNIDQNVSKLAAQNGVSEESIRNNASIMNDIAYKSQAPAIGRDQALGLVKTQAEAEAKALYESDKLKARADAENEIAKEMGKQLAGNTQQAQQLIDAFVDSQKDWGTDISSKFNDALQQSLGKIGKDSVDVANNVRNTFGKELADITVSDLQNIVQNANKNPGSVNDNTLQAIAQVMSQVDSAAKSTNTNIMISSQIGEVYQAAPKKENSGK